jgi:hypothetical protein
VPDEISSSNVGRSGTLTSEGMKGLWKFTRTPLHELKRPTVTAEQQPGGYEA